MAKIVDITDKLSFDENPVMVIRGHMITINSDAPTMLKIMALVQDDDKGEIEASLESYKLLIGEKDREVIDGMHLQYKDFIKVINIAMDIATGRDNTESGEVQTHTTT